MFTAGEKDLAELIRHLLVGEAERSKVIIRTAVGAEPAKRRIPARSGPPSPARRKVGTAEPATHPAVPPGLRAIGTNEDISVAPQPTLPPKWI